MPKDGQFRASSCGNRELHGSSPNASLRPLGRREPTSCPLGSPGYAFARSLPEFVSARGWSQVQYGYGGLGSGPAALHLARESLPVRLYPLFLALLPPPPCPPDPP